MCPRAESSCASYPNQSARSRLQRRTRLISNGRVCCCPPQATPWVFVTSHFPLYHATAWQNLGASAAYVGRTGGRPNQRRFAPQLRSKRRRREVRLRGGVPAPAPGRRHPSLSYLQPPVSSASWRCGSLSSDCALFLATLPSRPVLQSNPPSRADLPRSFVPGITPARTPSVSPRAATRTTTHSALTTAPARGPSAR